MNEQRKTVTLAIGRILRILARPTQAGDAEEYWRCRGIILDHSQAKPDHTPDYAHDWNKGAQGD